jgi:hypothetical protein
MKKLILLLCCCWIATVQAIPQTTDVGETLGWIGRISSQISSIMNTFKSSTRWIEVGDEIRKTAEFSNRVNQKYRNVRSMSEYASERNFIAFFNEAMWLSDKHVNSSRDYVNLITDGIRIGEKLMDILNEGGSAMDIIGNGADIGEIIASGGFSKLGDLFGFGKKNEKPDPQKILENLKANDDMLDKCYREIQEANAILNMLDSELSKFENFKSHEKTIRENSRYYIF